MRSKMTKSWKIRTLCQGEINMEFLINKKITSVAVIDPKEKIFDTRGQN